MTDADFLAWAASSDCRPMALVHVTVRISGVETTLYLSTRNFVTGAADTPSNTAYDAIVVGGARFSARMDDDGDTGTLSIGDIELENVAGVRDAWLGSDYVWKNRQVVIYIGDPRWPISDFKLVHDGVVDDIDSREENKLNLRLMDKTQLLNVPLSEDVLGGSTVNKDKLIPNCFGECFNVEPLCINPATQQYQFHSGASEDIIEANSGGAVPVTITKSVATGKFTLSAAPANTLICASVQGDKPSAFSRNIAVIFKRICKDFGPTATRLVDADLDLTQLSAFEAAFTQSVGLYAPERINKLEACRQLAASVGAQVIPTMAGKFRLVQYTASPAGTPIEVTASDMEEGSLHIADRLPVRATCTLGWGKNWRVVDAPSGGVPTSSSALYMKEWRTVTRSDSTVASVHKLDAAEVMEETLLIVESEAVTECERRRDDRKVQRQIYEATYLPHLLLTELGSAMTITHARFNLVAGKTGQVVNVERDWLRKGGPRIVIGVRA